MAGRRRHQDHGTGAALEEGHHQLANRALVDVRFHWGAVARTSPAAHGVVCSQQDRDDRRAFLGLEYSEQMLRYPENLDRSIPASKRQIWSMIDQAPQTTHVARWQREMSLSLRTCFEKRAGEVLNNSGYETLREDPSGSYLEEIRQILAAAWIALRRRFG